jgi:hypothetical protein
MLQGFILSARSKMVEMFSSCALSIICWDAGSTLLTFFSVSAMSSSLVLVQSYRYTSVNLKPADSFE